MKNFVHYLVFTSLILHCFTIFHLPGLTKPTIHPRKIPAFPGAQGFGSTTPGGRGGRVLEVTNLNADGPGSFRAACEVPEPRIVVFRSAGTIKLDGDIKIKNPYITIAGQTAPGDGICIRGAAIRIKTHDVIIRGLRIRVGDDPNGPGPGNRDGIGIANPQDPPYNIIIDHCSISWAIDENIATYKEVRDITFQWCIISEALRNSLHPSGTHSMAMLLDKYSAQSISIHHNLFAHNRSRQPKIQEGSETEIINNVFYNWEARATIVGEGANTNIIKNYYKKGPNTTDDMNRSHYIWKGIYLKREESGMKVYVEGNIGPGRLTDSEDEWAVVAGSEQFRSLAPPVLSTGVVTYSASTAYELVLKNAGAIKPHRDPVDERVVQAVRDGTGSLIDSQEQVGGWPMLAPGTPQPDIDHDGMPDEWEIARGLNPKDPADGNADRDGDGYTNVEEYLNGLLQ